MKKELLNDVLNYVETNPKYNLIITGPTFRHAKNMALYFESSHKLKRHIDSWEVIFDNGSIITFCSFGCVRGKIYDMLIYIDEK